MKVTLIDYIMKLVELILYTCVIFLKKKSKLCFRPNIYNGDFLQKS